MQYYFKMTSDENGRTNISLWSSLWRFHLESFNIFSFIDYLYRSPIDIFRPAIRVSLSNTIESIILAHPSTEIIFLGDFHINKQIWRRTNCRKISVSRNICKLFVFPTLSNIFSPSTSAQIGSSDYCLLAASLYSFN